MKYLIVSDIHGSITALDAVLAHYEQMGCDMLFLLGDLLNYGPRNGLAPGLDAPGVAARLNAMADQIVCVRGNCDSEVDQMLLDFVTSSSPMVTSMGRNVRRAATSTSCVKATRTCPTSRATPTAQPRSTPAAPPSLKAEIHPLLPPTTTVS